MVNFFRRLFIKDYANVTNEDVRAKHGKLAAWFGIVSNLLLVGMKLGVAFVLASQNAWVFSMALVGDAVNNLSDMASSLVTLIGFRISSKPADKEHPFGHERIEYIVGLIVSTTVIVVAVQLFRDSLSKVIAQETVQYDLVTVIILGIAVVVKLFQGYFNYGMGKAISSPALKATSVDSLTDSLATFLIMVSGILSIALGWNFLDGYMGMAVSVFVCYSGFKMIKETAGPLIGEATDKGFVDKIVKDVLAHPEIKGVHDVICHSYGPTKYFISLHAEVDESKPILESHDVIDNVEREIKGRYGVEATIHLDPIAIGDPETDRLKVEVADELSKIDPTLKFHDFRIVPGPTHTNIIFDIVLPFDDPTTKKTIVTKLTQRFASRDKKYNFVLNFDRPFDE
jgi:cation diffusion facilitator family transporter